MKVTYDAGEVSECAGSHNHKKAVGRSLKMGVPRKQIDGVSLYVMKFSK